MFCDCRNGPWTESVVNQPRNTAVTDDEELRKTMLTARENNFDGFPERDKRVYQYVTDTQAT